MSSDPELTRILVVARHGRFAEAEAQVRGVLARRPDDDWALRLLAFSLAGLGRDDEALAAAKAAVQVRPDQLLCWVQLSEILVKTLDPPGAVAAARGAVACAPTNPVAHHTLARAFLAQGEQYRPHTAHDPTSALAAADEAIRLAPDDPKYRNTRAWALVLLKRRRDATEEYHRVLALAPDNSTAVNGLGYMNRGPHPIVAARYHAAALRLSPQSEVIKINLKGAVSSWLYRMVWIWLWGGVALGLLHPFLPAAASTAGLLGLTTTCLVGTALLLRHLPRHSLHLVLSTPNNLLPLLTARLVGCIVAASLAALAPTPVWIWATAVIVLFVVLEWKVNFTAVERALRSRVRRR